MDLEAPADAWLLWLGVALVSLGLASFVLALPAQPPPDATKAANTIDRVASTAQHAQARYEHDATAVRVGPKQLSLRNDGGMTHDTIAFGSMTPVSAVSDPTHQRVLERITRGANVTAILQASPTLNATELRTAIESARTRVSTEGPAWQPTDDTLAVRKLTLDGETVVLVAV
jgi:sarcosine oxidase gamma subunit